MARLATIYRASDGREFPGHEFEQAQEWQRYLNRLAAGEVVRPPAGHPGQGGGGDNWPDPPVGRGKNNPRSSRKNRNSSK